MFPATERELVWGNGADRQRRRQDGRDKQSKRVCDEPLSCPEAVATLRLFLCVQRSPQSHRLTSLVLRGLLERSVCSLEVLPLAGYCVECMLRKQQRPCTWPQCVLCCRRPSSLPCLPRKLSVGERGHPHLHPMQGAGAPQCLHEPCLICFALQTLEGRSGHPPSLLLLRKLRHKGREITLYVSGRALCKPSGP